MEQGTMKHSPYINKTATGHAQKGAITLAVSLILLFLITLVTLAVSRNISIEQKIANNDVRSRLAFEAAEAGIAAALRYIDAPERDENNAVDFNAFYCSDTDPCEDDTTPDRFVGTAGTSTFEVRLAAATSADTFDIVSRGFSDDAAATRAIYASARRLDAVGDLPEIPLIATGSVGQGGSFTIINPEGDSTIWAGEDVSGGSAGFSTNIADPFDPDYPTCMNTPLTCDWSEPTYYSLGAGLDVVDSDTVLANKTNDELFVDFFNMTPEMYRTSVVETEINEADLGSYNQTDADILWINDDGDGIIKTSNMDEIGCLGNANEQLPQTSSIKKCPDDQTRPSIVIFDGDVDFSGGPHISGVVFVRGKIFGSGGGNSTVFGALLSDGTDNTFSGNITLVFHSGYIADSKELGPFFASPGTWRDFK
jgi:Tfp pilus assembly protein PilX